MNALQKRLTALETKQRYKFPFIVLVQEYDENENPIDEPHDYAGRIYTERELERFETVIIIHQEPPPRQGEL
jgi:2-oxo-4-hydroxy-4-carboxy--5-ureidoimidazoline (OHCU) decarboxylase